MTAVTLNIPPAVCSEVGNFRTLHCQTPEAEIVYSVMNRWINLKENQVKLLMHGIAVLHKRIQSAQSLPILIQAVRQLQAEVWRQQVNCGLIPCHLVNLLSHLQNQ